MGPSKYARCKAKLAAQGRRVAATIHEPDLIGLLVPMPNRKSDRMELELDPGAGMVFPNCSFGKVIGAASGFL